VVGHDILFFQSVVLFVKGSQRIDLLLSLMEYIYKKCGSDSDEYLFPIYRWQVRDVYWRYGGHKVCRPLETIVLPKETKDKITNDIENFSKINTMAFYVQHGIPYKRSYLFYGVPGSGKTSLLQSIAGKYRKKLCFVQPIHPEMTDDSFLSCIQSAPANSIVIIEDADALFDKNRKSKHSKCPLTFSGILNALDGLANPDGQIFILTTNFVEQLDDALVRSGRIDVHIHFPLSTDEQVITMFKLFYEDCDETLAIRFKDNVRQCFPKGVAMCTIQQHFIANMYQPAEFVVDSVKTMQTKIDVMAELDEKTKIKNEEGVEK